MKNTTAIESISNELKADYLKIENEKNESLNNIYQLRKEEEKLNANIYFFEKYLQLLEENKNEKESSTLQIIDEGTKPNKFANFSCSSDENDSNNNS